MASKELVLSTDDFGYWNARYVGGGEVPAALSGSWTRKAWAERDIANYFAEKSKPKREYRKSKNVKNTESTD